MFTKTKKKLYVACHPNDRKIFVSINEKLIEWRVHERLGVDLVGSEIYENMDRKIKKWDQQKIVDEIIQSAAVCVLVGPNTWCNRICRFEIMQAIICNRPLLALNIHEEYGQNSVNSKFVNILDILGIFLTQSNELRLAQKTLRSSGLMSLFPDDVWEWEEYAEHTSAIELPRGFQRPLTRSVIPLSDEIALQNWREDTWLKAIDFIE